MKIYYNLHEKYNKHYGCNCDSGHSLTYKVYTHDKPIQTCCKRMASFMSLNVLEMVDDKFGHLSNREDEWDEERIYQFNFCPFCGEKIEVICESHIRDVPVFEKKTVKGTRTKLVEEEYTMEKNVVVDVHQEKII